VWRATHRRGHAGAALWRRFQQRSALPHCSPQMLADARRSACRRGTACRVQLQQHLTMKHTNHTNAGRCDAKRHLLSFAHGFLRPSEGHRLGDRMQQRTAGPPSLRMQRRPRQTTFSVVCARIRVSAGGPRTAASMVRIYGGLTITLAPSSENVVCQRLIPLVPPLAS
jgi:hypothetical protein